MSLGLVRGNTIEAALVSVRPVPILVHLVESCGESLSLLIKFFLILVVLCLEKHFAIESEQLAQSAIDLTAARISLARR